MSISTTRRGSSTTSALPLHHTARAPLSSRRLSGLAVLANGNEELFDQNDIQVLRTLSQNPCRNDRAFSHASTEVPSADDSCDDTSDMSPVNVQLLRKCATTRASLLLSPASSTSGGEDGEPVKRSVTRWMTSRGEPAEGSTKHRISSMLSSPALPVVVTLLVGLAAILPDVVVASADRSHDDGTQGVLAGVFAFLVLEMLAMVWLKDKYFLSLLFLCDLVGTLAVLPVVMTGLGDDSFGASELRLVALLRLVRVLPEWLSNSKTRASRDTHPYEEGVDSRRRRHPKIGEHAKTSLSTRILSVLLIAVSLSALFELNTSDMSPQVGMAMLQTYASDAQVRVGLEMFQVGMQDNRAGELLYVSIHGLSRPAERPSTDHLRDSEFFVLTGANKAEAVFSCRGEAIARAQLSIGRTILVLAVLLATLLWIHSDVHRFFSKPIGRMISQVHRLGAVALSTTPEFQSLDETVLIESVLERLTGLFRLKPESEGVMSKTTRFKTNKSNWMIVVTKTQRLENDMSRCVVGRGNYCSQEFPELETIHTVLGSGLGSLYYKMFLASEYSMENMVFLEEVRAYNECEEHLTRMRTRIYKKYIHQDGTCSININHTVRLMIENELVPPFPYTFSDAESELIELMQRDSFKRFLDSEYCRALKQVLKAKDEAPSEEWDSEFPDECSVPNKLELDMIERAKSCERLTRPGNDGNPRFAAGRSLDVKGQKEVRNKSRMAFLEGEERARASSMELGSEYPDTPQRASSMLPVPAGVPTTARHLTSEPLPLSARSSIRRLSMNLAALPDDSPSQEPCEVQEPTLVSVVYEMTA